MVANARIRLTRVARRAVRLRWIRFAGAGASAPAQAHWTARLTGMIIPQAQAAGPNPISVRLPRPRWIAETAPRRGTAQCLSRFINLQPRKRRMIMLKLAALAALGYGAYRFVQSKRTAPEAPALLPVAGGPLSSDARVQPAPGAPTL